MLTGNHEKWAAFPQAGLEDQAAPHQVIRAPIRILVEGGVEHEMLLTGPSIETRHHGHFPACNYGVLRGSPVARTVQHDSIGENAPSEKSYVMDGQNIMSMTDCLGRILPKWDSVELFSLPLPGKFNIGDQLKPGVIAHFGLKSPARGSFLRVKPTQKIVVLHDNVRDDFEKIGSMKNSGLCLDPGAEVPVFARHGDFDAIWLSGPRTLVFVRPEKLKVSSYGVK